MEEKYLRQMHGRHGQSVVLLSVLVSEILTLHTAVHTFRFPRQAQALCIDAALFPERRMRSTVEEYKVGLTLRAAMSVRYVFWSCVSRMINELPLIAHERHGCAQVLGPVSDEQGADCPGALKVWARGDGAKQ